MIQINPKGVVDFGRSLYRHLRSIDLTEYPDEVRFLDAGKVGEQWLSCDDYESRLFNKCFAESKQDNAGKWETYDDILSLIHWVANGKYGNVPSPPNDLSPYRYYRKTAHDWDDIQVLESLPAQLRVSAPGTYLGTHPRNYIHLKIERILAGETAFTMHEGLGLHDVLSMLESGAYSVDHPDIDRPERTFRRSY